MDFRVLFIFLTFVVSLTKAFNYCDPKNCPYQGKHIRCNNNETFSKDCKGKFYLLSIDEYMNHILYEHNFYRDIIAEGSLKCFYTASRMSALKWDSHLTDNAKCNARTCKFGHDECRSTETFSMAGQNIYFLRTRNLKITPKNLMSEAVFLWFEEYLYANYTLMEFFEITIPQTGHYALLANDRCTHTGCAFLEMIESGETTWRTIIFTCNYSSTNIRNLPSYRAGKSASRCPKIDATFKNLCSGEGIDANDYNWYSKK